jgi:hypothetical protein
LAQPGLGTVRLVRTASPLRHTAEVSRAQDKISAQMRCTLDEALAAMNDLARLHDVTVEHVAVTVNQGKSAWFG